ncbi:hypothetical protein LBYZC6_09760 [Lacrimispora brassicae]
MSVDYEDDVSAKEETEIQSSWFQSQNEHSRRKKNFSRKKSKRKSKIISLMDQAASNCGLFFSQIPGKEENTFQVYFFVQKTWTGDRKKFHETF